MDDYICRLQKQRYMKEHQLNTQILQKSLKFYAIDFSKNITYVEHSTEKKDKEEIFIGNHKKRSVLFLSKNTIRKRNRPTKRWNLECLLFLPNSTPEVPLFTSSILPLVFI